MEIILPIKNRPDLSESPRDIDAEGMQARMKERKERQEQEGDIEQVSINISGETKFIKVSMNGDSVQEISMNDIKQNDDVVVWTQDNGDASVVLLIKEANDQLK